MKDLAILIPSWRGSGYLHVCLNAIRISCVTDYDVFIILNEASLGDVSICKHHNVKFIALDSNEGTLAVDHAIPYLRDYKYVANLNIDMIVCPNWDKLLLEEMERYGDKATVSSPAVEYNGGANGLDTLNDMSLPPFSNETIDQFHSNYLSGKYKFPNIISQRHPIICTVKDYLAAGGYSDHWDRNWFPGYTLDFDFPYRLFKYTGITNMVSVGKAPVFHDYSSTMKKLPLNLQQKHCQDYFYHQNGKSVDQFKREINFNKIID